MKVDLRNEALHTAKPRPTCYARIARDAPEILDRVKAGKFKSARAAAIEAGIIKPVPTIRLVEDLTKVATGIRKHLTAEQVQLLVVELTGTDR